MKHKLETLTKLKEFRTRVEKETNMKTLCLRTDRGGEYLSTDFTAYLRTYGIKRELTMARTPQQTQESNNHKKGQINGRHQQLSRLSMD